jgi:putative redox protein
METLLTANLTHPDFEFTITDTNENSMKMDIPIDQGGNGNGLRPMQTVLAALCGCSAVDVISILKKQKQVFDKFLIKAGGEREKGKEPALWETVYLEFVVEGEVDPKKLFKAAELSINKYCSVAETLRRAGAAIHFSVIVNHVKFQNQ